MSMPLNLVAPDNAYLNDAVAIMLSATTLAYPFRIYVNDQVWIDEMGFDQSIVYYDYPCTNLGIVKFQAWMWWPNPPYEIWSNIEYLTVSERPDNGNANGIVDIALPVLILAGIGLGTISLVLLSKYLPHISISLR